MSENIVDFLIIGAGAAGAAAAYNLAVQEQVYFVWNKEIGTNNQLILQIIWIGNITMKS